MSALLDMLSSHLDDRAIGQLSQQIGADRSQTQGAVQAALPLLVSALAKNSATPQGANALFGALSKDHDGGILEDVIGALGNQGTASTGAGILRHVLGDRRPAVEQGVGQHSGLSSQQIGQLMMLLAPLVMGALGRQQRQSGLDAGSLAGMLGQERQSIQQRAPQAGGLLGSLLDRDGDGSIADDLGRMGMGVLGNLFKGKR